VVEVIERSAEADYDENQSDDDYGANQCNLAWAG
jgi:hypothetical protein